MAEWQLQERIDDWEELDYFQRDKIIRALSNNFPLDFCQEIDKEIKSDYDWWVSKYDWGRDVRAYLNMKVFDKSELPKKSWDYYWVSAIEKSVEKVLESDRKE
jgi:hypothetical protein